MENKPEYDSDCFCQSCGMPLTEDFKGTNADGSLNDDYCTYCYGDGSFTNDMTMDEMIDHCLQFLDEFNRDTGRDLDIDDARAEMKTAFKEYKRWKQ